ncbi:MAG: hypothetical protein Q7T11_06245 [Deltaproteobacteria bacterium]|nr:hypothetical protein [Deltaproteobacteria bacterium]
MKKLFLLFFILAWGAPFKADAHPSGYPTSSYRYWYGWYGYRGWPLWNRSVFPNTSAGIRLVRLEMATNQKLAELGETQKAIWLSRSDPYPLIPAPIPPETLTAPQIRTNPKTE